MLHDDLPLRFGVNYTPLAHWYYCWNDWDADAVARDLDRIAEIGADHVRVQLLWPYFQPNPRYVSGIHLRRLRELMTACEARRLDVVPTILTGFLSGYFFLPPNVSRPDVFRSPEVFDAILRYFRRVLEVTRDCPNVLAIDLGNEVNCLDHSLPAEEGAAWAGRLLAEIEPLSGGTPVVNGIDHTPVFHSSTFSMEHLANDYPLITLHTWPFFTGCLKHGELDDPPSIHLAAFMAEYARAFVDGAVAVEEKPVWLQEFGCCDLWGDFDRRERYLRQTIDLAVRHGVTHFTFWCSHDKTRDIEFEEFEYHYGLIDTENRIKPLGEVYREVIAQYRQNPPPFQPPDAAIEIAADFRPRFGLAHPPAEWVDQQASSTLWEVFQQYLQAAADGKTPTIQRKPAV